MNCDLWLSALETGGLDAALTALYGQPDIRRASDVVRAHKQAFGAQADLRLFSAPGRVELCGNHTDHQQGCVVALAVHPDILGTASPRPDATVRLYSQNADPCEVDLNGPPPKEGTSDALIYGVARYLAQHGYPVGGFDSCTVSSIPFGSGLSSSAAFENFVATVFSCLYHEGGIPPLTKALAGQYAENRFFGKPCGLMDQLASCMGGVSYMDFARPDAPVCEPLSLPLAAADRVLCVVQTGGSHADLTSRYAAIPAEMKQVANALGCSVLSAATPEAILQNLPRLRKTCGDRAVLRSLNYFDEIQRVQGVKNALKTGNVAGALPLLTQSGLGSQCWLKNVSDPETPEFDGIGLCLYISKTVCPEGTYRVHGGGFAGTVLALVPTGELAAYQNAMDAVFGRGACLPLTVRESGGVELLVK